MNFAVIGAGAGVYAASPDAAPEVKAAAGGGSGRKTRTWRQAQKRQGNRADPVSCNKRGAGVEQAR